MRLLLTLALMLLALNACAPEAPRPAAIVFNSSLHAAHQVAPQSLAKPRTPLRFADGSAAANCVDYLKQLVGRELAETADNFAVRSEYLECDVLSVLGDRSVNLIRPADDANGIDLASRLDLRAFPSSLFNKADDKRHNLKTLFPDALRVSGNVVEVETADWHYRLELVAVTPVDANEAADWIVWWTDEARDGSYRAYRTLIIYDPAPVPGLMQAKVLY